MNITKLKDYTRGWLIGNFDPNVIKTNQFEFGIKKYITGDEEDKHYHKIAQEVTVIINGIFSINEIILKEGDVVFLQKNEESKFKCIASGYTAVIKTPSAKDDKYITK